MQFKKSQINKFQQALKVRFNVDLSPNDTEQFAIHFAQLMGIERKPRRKSESGRSSFRTSEWKNGELVETPWKEFEWTIEYRDGFGV